MRFRAEQHLRRQLDFRAARERGRRIECGGFTLWYRRRDPDTPRPPEAAATASSGGGEIATPTQTPARALPAFETPRTARVGVVASTAQVGNAVQRNRAKRRLREVFRAHQNLVPTDCDLLLIARRSLNTLPFAAIETRFVETCRRVFGGTP
jgi:ribonuclease P protein component